MSRGAFLKGAAIGLIAVAASGCTTPAAIHDQAVQASRGKVYYQVDLVRNKMRDVLASNGKLPEPQRSRRAMDELTDNYGRYGSAAGGSIMLLRRLPDGRILMDQVIYGAATVDQGFLRGTAQSVACVRFSGKPTADPDVTVTDIDCPEGVGGKELVKVSGHLPEHGSR
ncbi:MAG: hypothetical protein IRY84_07795 [Thermobispora bispora]|nr:hypothetical protein [Thermobispora bispora]